MNPDYLFCRTLDDIDSVIAAPDNYEIIRASGQLRQLLIDGNRLIDVVNKPHRLKILYEVSDGWDGPYAKAIIGLNPSMYAVLDGLCPELSSLNNPTRQLKRGEFLKFRAVLVQGHYVTIHDIICHCAHVMGGVHFGSAKTDGEMALSTTAGIQVGGAPISVRQLLSILRVVRKALIPLEQEVRL